MGKGTIVSGGTGGSYRVSVQYNLERVLAEKTANLAKISNLSDRISEETDQQKLNILRLQKLSLEKRNEALNSLPESQEITAWCVDLTEDLSGDVGLIEVPGESIAFNIQPGHEGNAVYDPTRDGQLTPTMAMTPAAAFYNLAMLPGWQKWRPTYRYGTITAIDGDTADVTLEAAASTQQGLGVNQQNTLTDVPIDYMGCNGSAFEVGDKVLVKFINQEWNDPTIIGFSENPAPCGWVERWTEGQLTSIDGKEWIKTKNHYWYHYFNNFGNFDVIETAGKHQLVYNHSNPDGENVEGGVITYWSSNWDQPGPFPYPDPDPPVGFILKIKASSTATGASRAYFIISDREYEPGFAGYVVVYVGYGPDFSPDPPGDAQYIDASGTDEEQVFDLSEYGIENPELHMIEVGCDASPGSSVSLQVDYIIIS